jgi:phosphocarrier protein
MRPAGDLCKLAMKYEAKIQICFRNKRFDAKSLLSVLSACVQQDDEITLVCSGADEMEAAREIAAYIENN